MVSGHPTGFRLIFAQGVKPTGGAPYKIGPKPTLKFVPASFDPIPLSPLMAIGIAGTCYPHFVTDYDSAVAGGGGGPPPPYVLSFTLPAGAVQNAAGVTDAEMSFTFTVGSFLVCPSCFFFLLEFE